MAEFVDERETHLATELIVVSLDHLPDILEKQNNLGRHRNVWFVREVAAHEQAQGVRLDAFLDERTVGDGFVGDGNSRGARAQIIRQFSNCARDFRLGQLKQPRPTHLPALLRVAVNFFSIAGLASKKCARSASTSTVAGLRWCSIPSMSCCCVSALRPNSE